MQLWGMMYTKMIIVVDETVDVHNYKAVVESILENTTSKNHLVISEGPLDALDHASNRAFQGFRLGIDATVKLPLETQGIQNSTKTIDEVMAHMTDNIDSPVQIEAFSKKSNLKALDHLKESATNINGPHWHILVDEWIDTTNMSVVSWKIFNNIDPMRDVIIETREDGSLFVGIDATKKGIEDGLMRPWPDDIDMSPEMVTYVNERWPKYGISSTR